DKDKDKDKDKNKDRANIYNSRNSSSNNNYNYNRHNNNKYSLNHKFSISNRMLRPTPILFIFHIRNPTRIYQRHLHPFQHTTILISTNRSRRRPKGISNIISIFLTNPCGDGRVLLYRRDVDYNGHHRIPGTIPSTIPEWA
ncbi:hypothetical protein BGZ52_001293, partial [Haplosporangium bisporale]